MDSANKICTAQGPWDVRVSGIGLFVPQFTWSCAEEWLITSAKTSQVSTSTGVISHFVNLQVVVPEAFILGSGELHVDMGSAINLVCIIEKVS